MPLLISSTWNTHDFHVTFKYNSLVSVPCFRFIWKSYEQLENKTTLEGMNFLLLITFQLEKQT